MDSSALPSAAGEGRSTARAVAQSACSAVAAGESAHGTGSLQRRMAVAAATSTPTRMPRGATSTQRARCSSARRSASAHRSVAPVSVARYGYALGPSMMRYAAAHRIIIMLKRKAADGRMVGRWASGSYKNPRGREGRATQ